MKKNHCIPKRRIRRQAFLLLEILIALTLVTLCLFPMMGALSGMRQATHKHALSIEKERLLDLSLSLLKEKISEDTLHDTGRAPLLPNSAWQMEYKIRKVKEHTKKKCALLNIDVTLKNGFQTYSNTFHLFVEDM